MNTHSCSQDESVKRARRNAIKTKEALTLRSGLTLSAQQADTITEILSDMVARIPARFALLSDTCGQIVAVSGEHDHSNLEALSTLMASDLAASQEIARLTGEYGQQQISFREGKQACSLIAEAGQHLILFAQIGNDVPIGWARMALLRTSEALVEVQNCSDNTEDDMEPRLDLEMDTEVLSDLFKNSLDDLWME